MHRQVVTSSSGVIPPLGVISNSSSSVAADSCF